MIVGVGTIVALTGDGLGLQTAALTLSQAKSVMPLCDCVEDSGKVCLLVLQQGPELGAR